MADATKDAIVQKFRTIATEYVQNTEKIKALQERQQLLEVMAQDCHAAARLFHFDVLAESAAFPQETPAAIEKPKEALPKPKTIRELVIEEAERTYPNPVKATPLKQRLEKIRGEKLHQKTVGMTLYRLSQDGVMKREGLNWFFVPTDQREENMKDVN